MARTGKYYSEYNRLLRNLRQRIYRARKTGLEYSEELIQPKNKRTPTKRELAKLNKELEEFNEKVYYVSPSSGEKTYGRKQAREAQRKETPQEPPKEPPKEPPQEPPDDGVIGARDILYNRLYDAINVLEYITSEQVSIMERTPRYRDKIYEIQAELLNAMRTPSEELYLTVQGHYDDLVEEATTALRYLENYSQAIDSFLRILGKSPTIEDTAWVSDTGDSYEETE